MSFIAFPVQQPLPLQCRGRYSNGETLTLNGLTIISEHRDRGIPAIRPLFKLSGFRT
jgi:hypothetical protein